MEKVITLADRNEAVSLFGDLDKNLKYIQKKFDVSIIARNQMLRLEGDDREVERVESLFHQLLNKVRQNQPVTIDHVKEQVSLLRGPKVVQLDNQSALISPQMAIPNFRTMSPGQGKYVELMKKFDINFAIGPAGTGKTYLAVAMAISALRQGVVQRIVLCRPAVEAGEKLGFLPGDFQQKVNPYLRPLYDALNDILGPETVKKYMEKEVIEVLPLAYMRGRTLNRSFIILDEAQNTTNSQMKMFLTRMGEGSRIVVTGDTSQTDLPDGSKSGLVNACRILKNVEGIAFSYLTAKDIVRHPLVAKVIAAYEKRESR